MSYSDGFFSVDETNGFLPIRDPLIRLPDKYNSLQKLTDSIPNLITSPNAIVKPTEALEDFTDLISGESDPFVLQALFRAYCFIASAYTLELAYQTFVQTGEYGQARQVLPACVAKPFVQVASMLDVYPWLDYHYAYSLGNYVKKDNSGSLDWRNLDMGCRFTNSPDEVGFIMVHVYINELSPQLIKGINSQNLKLVSETIEQMNSRRREMWTASRHEKYNDFRVFIMGIKGNEKIFGDGLVYSGCGCNSERKDLPRQYRGQTGAQDNIIPSLDIFTGIVDYYPENKLTEYLMDLRSYRPKCVQNFLHDLRAKYQSSKLVDQLVGRGDITGLVYLLKTVDQVYLFRNGHWQFVQKYIMSNVKYAFATGGTPITTWLINQIEAVLAYEKDLIGIIEGMGVAGLGEQMLPEVKDIWDGLASSYESKRKLLEEQVAELTKHNYNVELVYKYNTQANLEDCKLKHSD
jgi:indoleamine 2,3-dioxygenase